MTPPPGPSAEVALVADRLRAAGCVFAEAEAVIIVEEFSTPDAQADAVDRRSAGEPLEYVVGWAEFAGRRVAVGPGVFVPRRRTELVARVAIERARRGGTVVDLCCGSGAIAASVASARRDLAVVAADIDPTAVAMATTNLRHLGAAARVSDMDRSLPLALKGYVDLVTACPPYVPTGDIDSLPREARDHEPRLALDGGVDGTTVQREVFDAAFRLLRAGGIAVVETSEALSDATITAATEAGLEAGVEADEDIGATVVVATRR